MFAHEIAHLRWRDHWSQGFMLAAWCVHWFNPVVWIGFRRLRADRELSADEWVLKHLDNERALAYGETLFKTLAARSSHFSFQPGMVGISEDGAQMKQRLQRIAAFLPQRRIVGSLAGMSIVLLLGTVVLGQSSPESTATPAAKEAGKAATTPAASSEKVVEHEAQNLSDRVVAAARAGNAAEIDHLIKDSYSQSRPAKFNAEAAAKILNDLVQSRELAAFTVLLDPLQRTNYGREWKPSDELLTSLVKEGRQDFLDALLARRLDPARLARMGDLGNSETSGWIKRRVAELSKQRADIEALCKAVADNDLPTVHRLVEEGVDVNGVGKDDNTPLIRAMFKNRLEAAQYLLDHGALVDKPRLPGWNYTPLCLVNSVPMAELLKKNGADVHAKLFERDTSILTYVVDFAKADVVAWFLQQGLDAKMIGDNKENLLFGLKDGATAEVLLNAGADPNQIDEFGRTPLTAAISGEVARALIQHGANLKPKLPDGATLLEYAVTNTRRTDDTPQEQAGYIEELIKQGAEFDPKGNGVRAMIAAAFHDRVGEVQVLLDHGVSPNASYERGSDQYQSALSAAALQAPKSLKLLLERGADPNAPFPAGQMTPLDAALAWGAFGNVDLLRQAGAKGLSDLAYYTAKGDVAKVSELLDQHADPNEAGSSGWTPLIYAVKRAQVEVAKRLLDHGASVDQFDGFGFSPYLEFILYRTMIEQDSSQAQLQWHLSSQEAKARLATFEQLFTQHPPNPAYRDNAGRSALHQAAWAGNSMIVGLMLEGHPPRFDPNLPDKEGKTPLLLVALSPVAKDTREIITTDMGTPQQKKWNLSANLADELLKSGARLDVVVAEGKRVGELALAAARDANNPQLVAVLTGALNSSSGPQTASPVPPSASPVAAASSGQDAASARGEARDLANLDPKQYDTIWTAAFDAIKKGDIQTIDGFLRRGLDANVDLIKNSSLLFLAVDDNHLAIVKLLLAHGANVQQKTSWGDLPLKRACWRGYRDIADALIQAGSPVNELWYATGMGDVPALEARDQRQPITPKEARDHLSFAVASGHPDTFDFLWKKLGPLSDTEKDKLLGNLYEKVGEWGHPNMLPILEALGATAAKNGSRALMEAALGNHSDTVKALLERGVSPDEPPKGWGYSLRDAAGDGRIEIVRVLLDHGANINVQDDHGFTSLSWAAYCGKEDICLLLLERGADGRIEDRDGHNSAWHAAAGPHCAEALARMIQGGVPVTGKDKRGKTILDHMMGFGMPEAESGTFFMKVYSPADIERFNENERRVVELLLAAGVNADGGGDEIPLIQAMQSNHYAAARVLFAHGADPARKDKDGNSPLYTLIGYVADRPLPLDLFKTLWQRSGSLNPEFTVPGVTPPMETSLLETVIVAAGPDPLKRPSLHESIKIMLDGGAKFAAVADDNVQALLQGAVRGNLAVIQQSIQQGAPVSAAADGGWDALSITTALGYNDCSNWLIDHGADVIGHHRWPWNAPLPNAVAGGRTDLVEKLLAKGATLNGVFNGLAQAVRQKNARLCEVLLKAGADPKEGSGVTMSTGGKTYTPRSAVMLYQCIENGLTDMARTLLDKGAEAEPPNLENNRNLAYWAVDYDRPEILQSLLVHGANPLVKDDKGTSALDLARESHPKMVPMLE